MRNLRVAIIAKLFLVLICGGLASCGGGGSDASSGNDAQAVQSGQFKDSYVQGLRYTTATQSGLTDANGTFHYLSGERVTLSVGGVVIGTAAGAPLVIPSDLVSDNQSVSNPIVTNIARFLQTLDADGNPDNGITIPPAAHTALASASLDFSNPAFGNSPALVAALQKLNDKQVFADTRQLVSTDAAQRHLLASVGGSVPATPASVSPVRQTILDGPAYSNVLSALDSSGHVHLFVGGDHLYHFVRDTSGWHADSVAGIASSGVWLKKVFVDAHGAFHLFFTDANGWQYASNATGAWVIESIYAADYVVDAAGGLHVITVRSATTFAYGSTVNGVWAWDTFTTPSANGLGSASLASASPELVKLALDASGHAHIVFSRDDYASFESSAIYYASNASGTWQSAQLQSAGGVRPNSLDLVADALGNPHVLYAYTNILYGSQFCAGPCPSRDHVGYFTKSNGQWQSELADGGVGSEAIRFRYVDDQHVGYFSGSTFTQKIGSTWTPLSMPFGAVGSLLSTDTTSGSPSSFYSVGVQSGNVNYATFANGAWTTEQVASLKPVGQFSNMTMDAAGSQHISYWNAADRTLRYATQVNGGWHSEVAAQNVDMNSQTVIAVGASGEIHIAYLDSTSYALQHVHKLGGAWRVDTVSPTSFGSFSMALDVGGAVNMLYIDTRQSAWMHATNVSGTWVSNQVVSVQWNIAGKGRLSVAPSGDVYACIDSDNYSSNTIRQGLWLAKLASGATVWQFENVAPAISSGSDCWVDAKTDGTVALAYRIDRGSVGTWDKLIYASKDGSGWHSETVATGIFRGISMITDPKLGRVMAYYNAGEGYVSYAYRSGSSWTAKTLINLNMLDQAFLAPMAIDATGALHTVYFDSQQQDLIALTIDQP
ncbi:MAG: hypothetical protein EPO09_15465 [Aquabacterium sp.]|uniref:hypothetical protein n=1 Tax=Aquabacterium sp. TaxID=1872578 RepID=UPI001226EBDC|nr:hypothetical protein [Aquabacterium sp.]TAK92243.1 MAG: hypothetical protein EPO09_15465 [Aquabacterium sp.]